MGWLYKIVIRDLTKPFDDKDLTDEEAIQLGKRFAERIKESKAFRDPCLKHELGEIIEDFDSEVFDQQDINNVLDDLYDFGDAYRVWIGNTNLDLQGDK